MRMRNSSTLNRSYIVVWVVMFTTLLLKIMTIEGQAPSLIKFIFAAGLWVSLLMFPYDFVRNNDLGKSANFLLKIIVLLVIIAVLRSMFGNIEGHVGNKWLTLFGNDTCMFMLLTPCFIYLSKRPDSVFVLKAATQTYLFIGTLVILWGNVPTPRILWFSAVLFPFMNKLNRLLVIIS